MAANTGSSKKSDVSSDYVKSLSEREEKSEFMLYYNMFTLTKNREIPF